MACQDLVAGAECLVTLSVKTLEGKCIGDPHGEGPLVACAPPPQQPE